MCCSSEAQHKLGVKDTSMYTCNIGQAPTCVSNDDVLEQIPAFMRPTQTEVQAFCMYSAQPGPSLAYDKRQLR
jgi:hypothetical protein